MKYLRTVNGLNDSKLQLLGGCIAILWGIFLWVFAPGLHATIEATADVPVDWHKYVAMAEQPLGTFRIAPFCHRLLVPWVAAQLPFHVMTNFALVQFAAFFVLGAGVTRVALRIGRPGYCSLQPICWLLGLGWVTKSSLAVTASVDLAAWSVLVWVFAFALESRTFLVLTFAILAVTIKEASLLAVISMFLLSSEYVQIRRWVPLVVVGSCLAVLGTLQVVVIPGNMDNAYTSALGPLLTIVNGVDSNAGLVHSLHVIGWARFATLTLADVNAMTLDSFGVCVFAAIVVVWRAQRRVPWDLLAAMALCLSVTLVAVNIQRPVLIAAPVFIVVLWSRMPLSVFREIIISCAAVVAIYTIFTARESVSVVVQGGVLISFITGFLFLRRLRPSV
jgi:hypothetical protein